MSEIFPGYQKAKGFRVFQEIDGLPLLAGVFKKFGVSKIQGFQGKYIKYELGQKCHRTCIMKSNCDLPPLWGKLDRLDTALHGKDIKYGNQLFDNPLLLHF